MRFAAGVAAVLALAGCARHELFPLELGRSWTYNVRTGFPRSVEQLKVEAPTAVAGVDGWQLASPLGVARVAWKDGVLLAEETSNLRFTPPLPILVDGEPKATRTWKGTVRHLGREFDAAATLMQSEGRDTLGSKQVDVVKTDLRIRLEGHEILVRSAYASGVGLVRQRQETDGRFDVEMEFLGGG
ncbi:MAG: hypothetical protein M9921_05025 [Fimbriimonadaceae bacterium]|nr:hypothetical protein [Fimbriimonadaceae bacterium]